MPMTSYRAHLESIFRAGLDRVDPYRMIASHVFRRGDRLEVNTEGCALAVDLNDYERVLLLGAGKASAPMARAFEELLGERIAGGLICVKEGHEEPLRRVELVAASHPLPDERGLAAARRLAALARQADGRTLVISCISGGGSALLPSPLDRLGSNGLVEISLADKQATTNALLRCGAGIREINCLRKHISGMKGGRFLQLLAPARSLNFILSDVVGDDLGSIASGMTAADPTTYADAMAIVRRYGLFDQLPESVRRALEFGVAGKLPETVKPGDPVLARSDNILIGTNRQALLASARRAAELGYEVRLLSARIEGEARHVAKTLADIAGDAVGSEMFVAKPACLLVGGETVVTLRGNGKGGRNQEMALAFLAEMAQWGEEEKRRVAFLAAATDGNDGPTDAAGAFADLPALRRVEEERLDIAGALANNDAYPFFARIDGLLRTGPTNTNVCDIQIVLIR
jgi:glycerate 2-kinase